MYISLLTSLHRPQLFILQNVLSSRRLDSVPTFHSCPRLSAVQSFWALLGCSLALASSMVALRWFTIVSPYTPARHELCLFLFLWNTRLGRTVWTHCIWGEEVTDAEAIPVDPKCNSSPSDDYGSQEHISPGFRYYIVSYLATDASEHDLFLIFTVTNRSNPRYTKYWIETYKSLRCFCFSGTVQITRLHLCFGTR